ncbi:hypothetical protein CLOSTHATH_03290, partial [Hungatella hathewayi DSM 13479]
MGAPEFENDFYFYIITISRFLSRDQFFRILMTAEKQGGEAGLIP